MPKYQGKNLSEGNNLTSAPEIIHIVSFSGTAQAGVSGRFPQLHPHRQGKWRVQELERCQ